jgi:hypothetical protein
MSKFMRLSCGISLWRADRGVDRLTGARWAELPTFGK